MSIESIESIITTYQSAYRRAKAAGDIRAEFYGRRLTMWIQRLEAEGGLEDSGNAFQMGRYSNNSGILVVS